MEKFNFTKWTHVPIIIKLERAGNIARHCWMWNAYLLFGSSSAFHTSRRGSCRLLQKENRTRLKKHSPMMFTC